MQVNQKQIPLHITADEIYSLIKTFSKQGTHCTAMMICKILGKRHHVINQSINYLLKIGWIKSINRNGIKHYLTT